MTRVAGAAEALGIAVVMLDVLDCGDPAKVAKRLALYTSYGFQAPALQRLAAVPAHGDGSDAHDVG